MAMEPQILIRLSLAIIISAVICSKVSAQVYQWQDEQGVIHFSDKPVSGAEKVRLIELNKQPANDDGTNQIERNRRWFNKYSEQRYRRQAAATEARRKQRRSSSQKGADRCHKLKTKLADVKDKYRAQKRQGISFALAKQQKQKIKLQKNKIKREC